MKKENRKLAQQRRAQERKKQEKVRKLKKFLAWFIPSILILLLVIVLVADAVRNSGSEPCKNVRFPPHLSEAKSSPEILPGESDPTPPFLHGPGRSALRSAVPGRGAAPRCCCHRPYSEAHSV